MSSTTYLREMNIFNNLDKAVDTYSRYDKILGDLLGDFNTEISERRI